MSKVCTSMEQSKKLIELGIDKSTADMHYLYDYNIDEYGDNAHPQSELGQHFSLFPEDIPAWSLSALLELIPEIIEEDYVLRIDKADGEYYIWYDKIGEGWSDAMAHPLSENFVDAAFEMICWLKENKKL